jgi:ubiquinone biosynthesis protein
MYSTSSSLLPGVRFKLRPVNWVLTFAATILIGITQIHAGAQAVNRPSGQDDRKHVSLPTPRTHYDTFKRGTTGLPVLIRLLKEFDPEAQQTLLQLAIVGGLQDVNPAPEIAAADRKQLKSMIEATGLPKQLPFTKEQAVAAIKKTRWAEHRAILIELIVHQSDVLELIPEKWGAIWGPIVHDAMLFFLDHLSDERLLEKIVGLAMLPPNTSRADYLAEFVSKMPCLQKMGQILARNPDLAPDHQKVLQNLESGIRTMSGPELSQFIISDIGKQQIDQYQMQFSDEVLGEASVGAVMLATGIPPGTAERRQMVCKVVKPYVLVDMPEDLAIVDGLAEYFTTHHDFYNLGSMPLVEIFKEIRKALTNEINIVAEQKNFIRAREYYKGSKKVVIPKIYPISNDHVTVMELIKGEKITSAFSGDASKRSMMARELSDTMTGDVIFSKQPEAIFHGDPHPGNVYHLTSDPAHPYKIALLDWGLMGTFPREDRMALVQLIVGVRLKDAKRLHENVGFLVEGGIPNDPGKWQKVDALIAEVIKPQLATGVFEGLQNLVSGLIEQGYATKFDLNTFIKSQLTIAGELIELDPKLKQDDLIEKHVTSMVKKELPKRIPCMIFCRNSRNYRSMLSNNDVKALRKKMKKKTAAPPAAQPAPAAKVQSEGVSLSRPSTLFARPAVHGSGSLPPSGSSASTPPPGN